jgi:ribosome-binding protein aMBF1 (putative translation factor)
MKAAILSEEEKILHASSPHEAPDKGVPHDHIHESHRHPHSNPKSPRQIFLETLGKNVKAMMEMRGLTKKRLAKKAGVSVTTLQRVLDGRTEPSFDTLDRIASILSFPICIVGTQLKNGK